MSRWSTLQQLTNVAAGVVMTSSRGLLQETGALLSTGVLCPCSPPLGTGTFRANRTIGSRRTELIGT